MQEGWTRSTTVPTLQAQGVQLTSDNQQLQEQARQLSMKNTVQLTQPAVPCPEQGLAIPLPERFDGNPRLFQGFMNQRCLMFLIHPQIYASNRAKIALVISLLTGDALDWASPLLEGQSLVLSN